MPILTRLKSLSKDLLPPVVTRAIRHLKQSSNADPAVAAIDHFYGSLLSPNALCFDVGANVGNRVTAFRRLNFRVVALEPQPQCFARLQASFGADHGVTLLNKALGSAPGEATMMVSNVDVVSTMSQAFIDATTQSQRFGNVTWDKAITVEMVTLDQLIAEHGVPDFIKIDVEGYELEVIRGLSRPIALISLEWTPELTDTLLDCIAHLSRLGAVEFNLSWVESMKLARRAWMNEEAVRNTLNQFREETFLFGDVYIRSKVAA